MSASEVGVIETEVMTIAAARGHATIGELPKLMGVLADRVWTLVRAHGFTTNHNVVLYEGDVTSSAGADIEVGVQVDRAFTEASDDGVRCVEVPATTVARAMHAGPYDQLPRTHGAVLTYCREHGLELTGVSWEIYGDWDDDQARLQTEVVYAIRR